METKHFRSDQGRFKHVRGMIVTARRLNDDDHTATCKGKSRYCVHLNAAGRVVAEKQ